MLELKNTMSDKEKLYIFDTTMRDGEQSPGASMSVEEKIQISRVCLLYTSPSPRDEL